MISRWEEEGERQPSLPELGAAMPQEALIYEDADHLVYGFASDAAMREACGFPPFGPAEPWKEQTKYSQTQGKNLCRRRLTAMRRLFIMKLYGNKQFIHELFTKKLLGAQPGRGR